MNKESKTFLLINNILKNGACKKVYRINGINYYKMLYNNINYIISVKDNIIKLELMSK